MPVELALPATLAQRDPFADIRLPNSSSEQRETVTAYTTMPAELCRATLPAFNPEWREFRRSQGKATKIWQISVEPDGESFRIRQGKLGEELTEGDSRRPGQKGRPGSRTYISASDACSREVTRQVEMQRQKGFVEFIDGKPVAETERTIDFSKPFPPDLLTPKPRTSISPTDLKKLHDQRRMSYTRKYDGIGVTLVHHSYGWAAYTLANNCVSEHFPTQIKALARTEYGVGTILKGEAVIFKADDPWYEDFNLINARFSPSRNPITTQTLIKDGKIPEPTFVIYDILFRDGVELHDVPYRERVTHWQNLPVARGGNGPVTAAEFIPDLTPENWMDRRIALKIEGWVANDYDATLGRNALTYSQAPARPSGIYKLKPNVEEDVVIYAVRQVDGEYQSVFTKQRYPDSYPRTEIPIPEAGEWFYTGRVSLHRSPVVAEEIDKLVKAGLIYAVPDNQTGESLAIDNDFGVTAVIEFFERQKGGKFRHAVFPENLRFRTEGSGDYKAPAQCFAQTLVLNQNEAE